MLKKVLITGLIGAMGILGCSRNDAAKQAQNETKTSIQIKGSDTMVNLVQAWAEAFMKKNSQKQLAVTGGGSGTGISALISSTCDICMSSRNIKDKEIELSKQKGVNPNEIKVALDGLAVVVHPSNQIGKLTRDQLADIFTSKVVNWKELGGKDARIVILSREVTSGTHVYFKEHILRKGNANGTEEFASSALMLPSSQAIADEVANNPDAIGYYGMGYISPKQKAIAVALNANSEYETPTLENVVSGKYPISRPLLFYTNGEPKGLVKEFVDFTLSPEGQDIVKKMDFVPIK